MLGLSPLLTNIMMGTVLVNVMRHSTRVFGSINDFASPVYILFFTLAGASLDLRILMSVGLMGLGYIVARAGGKMLGAYVGARRVGAEDAVRKYLGLTLLPQGGISIDCRFWSGSSCPSMQCPSRLLSCLVCWCTRFRAYFSKIAIQKAGEIGGVDGPEKA